MKRWCDDGDATTLSEKNAELQVAANCERSLNSFCSVQLESFQRLRAFDNSRRDWAKSFGQLWRYEREGWARRFFENLRSSRKGQRLKPYEKFAAVIDRHWDGIAAYCRPENKGSSYSDGHRRRTIRERCKAEMGGPQAGKSANNQGSSPSSAKVAVEFDSSGSIAPSTPPAKLRLVSRQAHERDFADGRTREVKPPKWECKYPVVFHCENAGEETFVFHKVVSARKADRGARLCRDDGAMMNSTPVRCAIFPGRFVDS